MVSISEKLYKWLVSLVIGSLFVLTGLIVVHFQNVKEYIVSQSVQHELEIAIHTANTLQTVFEKTMEQRGVGTSMSNAAQTMVDDDFEFDSFTFSLFIDIATQMKKKGVGVKFINQGNLRVEETFEVDAWESFKNADAERGKPFFVVDKERQMLNFAVPVHAHGQDKEQVLVGSFVIQMPIHTKELMGFGNNWLFWLITSFIIVSVLLFAIIFIRYEHTSVAISSISEVLDDMQKGDLPEYDLDALDDNLGRIAQGINGLSGYLKNAARFAARVGKGNFDAKFGLESENDVLGKALIDMRDSLRRVEEEDRRRRWASDGIAEFGRMLTSGSDNLEELGDLVIKNLVSYLGANQGIIFVVTHDGNSQSYLEMTSCYAYERKKYRNARIMRGEGLCGQCWTEDKKIYMTDIPKDYVTITSGLGGAVPSCILLLPLSTQSGTVGILEIASFNPFEDYEIEFVEKVAESLAMTIGTVQTNERTAELLKESQTMAKEMKIQEEDMRQHMEELKATQEATMSQEMELKENILKLEEEVMTLKADVNENDSAEK